MVRTPSRKWELNSNLLNARKECGSILSSRLLGGASRDDTKNDCVGGSSVEWIFRCLSMFFKMFTKRACSFTSVLFSTPFTFSHINYGMFV